MRKYNPGFIFFEILVITVICVIATLLCSYVLERPDLSPLVFFLTAYACFLTTIMGFPNLVFFSLAKKTMERSAEEDGFVMSRTIYSREWASCASVLAIDEVHRKIAYVSVHNPFKFQTADVKDLSKLYAGYKRGGPFGGTRYVFYQFVYKNKRTRIPTFTSRRPFIIGSAQVQNALATAKSFVDTVSSLQALDPEFQAMALAANAAAAQRTQTVRAPFSKKGVVGIVLAVIAADAGATAFFMNFLFSLEGSLNLVAVIFAVPAFILALIGFILSLIGIAETKNGAKRGRGLAITATVVLALVLVLTVALAVQLLIPLIGYFS